MEVCAALVVLLSVPAAHAGHDDPTEDQSSAAPNVGGPDGEPAETATIREDASAAPPPGPPPRQPPTIPEFMNRKRGMRDEDLRNKVDGGYVTGFPLWTSDPDTGMGFGARVVYFDNGSRSDGMFAFTPYRHRVYLQGLATTNGYQFHTIDYDAPYIFDSPVRLRANVTFEKNIAGKYFGTGPRTLGSLSFPGSELRYASESEYTEALRRLRPDGTAYTRYDQFILENPSVGFTLEHDFFGGVVRGLAGFTGSYVGVRQWTGRTVRGDEPSGRSDVEARQAPTRLDEDCARGALVGCGGGFNNTLKLGIAFDTRDFEPDPNTGVFIDLTTEIAARPLGSDFDWARVTFSPRAFFSPFPKLTDLVIAGRLVGSVITEDVPFFSMSELSFTDRNLFGLGGIRTIRGFKQNRFVGRTVALANVEVRWTFWEVAATRSQRFAFMLVPFFDVGRVFDTIDDFELRRFRNGQGAGLRIAWNQASITVFDYAVSREGTTFYINSTHPF